MSRFWVPHKEHAWLPGDETRIEGNKAVFEVALPNRGVKDTVTLTDKETCGLAEVFWDQESGVDDVCALSEVHDAALLNTVRVRYMESKIYTRVQRTLIALNPFANLPLYSSEYLDMYSHCSDSMDRPPHIFGISQDALQGLGGHDARDQAILIGGESGAGKTESTKLILSFVANTSKHADDAKLQDAVLQTNPVLEAFGNAMTVRNNNSSRFGKWLDLRFTPSLGLRGGSLTSYLLETTRVCQQSALERNFHVFYMLLAARDQPKFRELKLGEPRSYRYLKVGLLHAPGISDSENLIDLCEAFSAVGFNDDERMGVFRVVAGILTLGNVDFVADASCDGAKLATEGPDSPFELAASLLRMDPQALKEVVMVREVVVGKEVTKTPMRLEAVNVARDALARLLYGKVFLTLIKRMNRKLSGNEREAAGERLLGILDIAGFESFEKNSLEQLLINLSNENLQQHFNKVIFKEEIEECRKEGVDLSEKDLGFVDNADCLELIGGKGGLLELLDETMVVPKHSAQLFVQKVQKSFDKHNRLIMGKILKLGFGIRHYAGDVHYDCDGWLEKNGDWCPESLAGILCQSKCPIVEEIGKDLLAENDAGKTSPVAGRGRRTKSVSRGFCISIKTLMEKIHKSDPHYVRCVKPNPDKVPLRVDGAMVIEQLLMSGVLAAVKIRRQGYPHRLLMKHFVTTYGVGLGAAAPTWPHKHDEMAKWQSAAIAILQAMPSAGVDIRPNEYAVGKTKVFIKENAVRLLDTRRREVLGTQVVMIQAYARSYLARKRLKATKVVYEGMNEWLRKYKLYDAVPVGASQRRASRCASFNPGFGIVHMPSKGVKPLRQWDGPGAFERIGSEAEMQKASAEVALILHKAEELHFEHIMRSAVATAERRVKHELDVLRDLGEHTSSVDEMDMDKIVAKAHGLALPTSCPKLLTIEKRLERLRIEKSIVRQMESYLAEAPQAVEGEEGGNELEELFQDLIADVREAGLEAPSAHWVTGPDSAMLLLKVKKRRNDIEGKKAGASEALGGVRRRSSGRSRTNRCVSFNDLDEVDSSSLLARLKRAGELWDATKLEELLRNVAAGSAEGEDSELMEQTVESARRIFERLQSAEFLTDFIAAAKVQLDEEVYPPIVLLKRLDNISQQLERMEGYGEEAAEAKAVLQMALKERSSLGGARRKSVFDAADPEELALATRAFSNLSNFAELRPSKVWVENERRRPRTMTAIMEPGGMHSAGAGDAGMLLHDKACIGEPLTLCPVGVPEDEFVERSIQNFRNLMIAMYDRPAQEAQRFACGAAVVKLAQEDLGLRNEIFVQVLKQLSGNSNPRSLRVGWEILHKLCLKSPPVGELPEFLMGFLREVATKSALPNDHQFEQLALARCCDQALEHSLQEASLVQRAAAVVERLDSVAQHMQVGGPESRDARSRTGSMVEYMKDAPSLNEALLSAQDRLAKYGKELDRLRRLIDEKDSIIERLESCAGSGSGETGANKRGDREIMARERLKRSFPHLAKIVDEKQAIGSSMSIRGQRSNIQFRQMPSANRPLRPSFDETDEGAAQEAETESEETESDSDSKGKGKSRGKEAEKGGNAKGDANTRAAPDESATHVEDSAGRAETKPSGDSKGKGKNVSNALAKGGKVKADAEATDQLEGSASPKVDAAAEGQAEADPCGSSTGKGKSPGKVPGKGKSFVEEVAKEESSQAEQVLVDGSVDSKGKGKIPGKVLGKKGSANSRTDGQLVLEEPQQNVGPVVGQPPTSETDCNGKAPGKVLGKKAKGAHVESEPATEQPLTEQAESGGKASGKILGKTGKGALEHSVPVTEQALTAKAEVKGKASGKVKGKAGKASVEDAPDGGVANDTAEDTKAATATSSINIVIIDVDAPKGKGDTAHGKKGKGKAEQADGDANQSEMPVEIVFDLARQQQPVVGEHPREAKSAGKTQGKGKVSPAVVEEALGEGKGEDMPVAGWVPNDEVAIADEAVRVDTVMGKGELPLGKASMVTNEGSEKSKGKGKDPGKGPGKGKDVAAAGEEAQEKLQPDEGKGKGKGKVPQKGKAEGAATADAASKDGVDAGANKGETSSAAAAAPSDACKGKALGKVPFNGKASPDKNVGENAAAPPKVEEPPLAVPTQKSGSAGGKGKASEKGKNAFVGELPHDKGGPAAEAPEMELVDAGTGKGKPPGKASSKSIVAQEVVKESPKADEASEGSEQSKGKGKAPGKGPEKGKSPSVVRPADVAGVGEEVQEKSQPGEDNVKVFGNDKGSLGYNLDNAATELPKEGEPLPLESTQKGGPASKGKGKMPQKGKAEEAACAEGALKEGVDAGATQGVLFEASSAAVAALSDACKGKALGKVPLKGKAAPKENVGDTVAEPPKVEEPTLAAPTHKSSSAGKGKGKASEKGKNSFVGELLDDKGGPAVEAAEIDVADTHMGKGKPLGKASSDCKASPEAVEELAKAKDPPPAAAGAPSDNGKGKPAGKVLNGKAAPLDSARDPAAGPSKVEEPLPGAATGEGGAKGNVKATFPGKGKAGKAPPPAMAPLECNGALANNEGDSATHSPKVEEPPLAAPDCRPAGKGKGHIPEGDIGKAQHVSELLEDEAARTSNATLVEGVETKGKASSKGKALPEVVHEHSRTEATHIMAATIDTGKGKAVGKIPTKGKATPATNGEHIVAEPIKVEEPPSASVTPDLPEKAGELLGEEGAPSAAALSVGVDAGKGKGKPLGKAHNTGKVSPGVIMEPSKTEEPSSATIAPSDASETAKCNGQAPGQVTENGNAPSCVSTAQVAKVVDNSKQEIHRSEGKGKAPGKAPLKGKAPSDDCASSASAEPPKTDQRLPPHTGEGKASGKAKACELDGDVATPSATAGGRGDSDGVESKTDEKGEEVKQESSGFWKAVKRRTGSLFGKFGKQDSDAQPPLPGMNFAHSPSSASNPSDPAPQPSDGLAHQHKRPASRRRGSAGDGDSGQEEEYGEDLRGLRSESSTADDTLTLDLSRARVATEFEALGARDGEDGSPRMPRLPGGASGNFP